MAYNFDNTKQKEKAILVHGVLGILRKIKIPANSEIYMTGVEEKVHVGQAIMRGIMKLGEVHLTNLRRYTMKAPKIILPEGSKLILKEPDSPQKIAKRMASVFESMLSGAQDETTYNAEAFNDLFEPYLTMKDGELLVSKPDPIRNFSRLNPMLDRSRIQFVTKELHSVSHLLGYKENFRENTVQVPLFEALDFNKMRDGVDITVDVTVFGKCSIEALLSQGERQEWVTVRPGGAYGAGEEKALAKFSHNTFFVATWSGPLSLFAWVNPHTERPELYLVGQCSVRKDRRDMCWNADMTTRKLVR